MGLEILEQVPDLDAAIIPVGGGGLIAGVAKALKTMKPGVKIIVIISYLILQNYKINKNVLKSGQMSDFIQTLIRNTLGCRAGQMSKFH